MRITVGPRVSAAAISAFSVAITEGSSIRKSQGLRPGGRLELDVAAVVVDRARRARGTRPGAGRGGGGRSRRHPAAACGPGRTAPAAGRRAGTRRGCARPARDRPPCCRRSRCRSRSRRGRATARARRAARAAEHRLDVPDPGDVAQDHLVVGEQARGQDRSAPFLLPAGVIVPDRGTPPSITNFSIGGRSVPARVARPVLDGDSPCWESIWRGSHATPRRGRQDPDPLS